MADRQQQDRITQRDDAIRRAVAACVPLRQWETVVDTHRCAEWSQTLRRIMRRREAGMLCILLGDRGRGKTQLAVEVMREAITAKQTARYTTAVRLFLAIKRTFDTKGASEADVLDTFARPALLIIDEAHQRAQTDWESMILATIVDERYMNRRDTIIISNESRDEFIASMDDAIVSRAEEVGGVIECAWPSFRKDNIKHE